MSDEFANEGGWANRAPAHTLFQTIDALKYPSTAPASENAVTSGVVSRIPNPLYPFGNPSLLLIG